MKDLIEICLDCSSSTSFAANQNKIPFIRSLVIKNNSDKNIKDVTVTLETVPGFCPMPVNIRIDEIPANQSIKVSDRESKLPLDPTYLMGITERLVGNLSVKVSTEGQVLATTTKEVDILAYNQFHDNAELIAAFVTPNHPSISSVLRKASEILSEQGLPGSICGYLKQDENFVLDQMWAIYRALQKLNISYATLPPSFEPSGQKVRLCDDIFKYKIGNCLDMSLLYASCLEAAGLNPLVFFIKGHAFVGCWLIDEKFSSTVQDDFSQVAKRFHENVGEIAVVEATSIATISAETAESSISFDEARKLAENHFNKPEDFNFFIDIKRTRLSNILPVPQRKFNAEGKLETPFEPDEANDLDNKLAPEHLDIVPTKSPEGPVKLDKIRLWQNKLLNMSLQNTLLNFRPRGCIQLIVPNLGFLEDGLAEGKEFIIDQYLPELGKAESDDHIFILDRTKATDNLLESEFKSRRLHTYLNEIETKKKIQTLYRNSRTSIEESGSNTLFLALGFLKWFETEESTKPRFAPLILLPLEIVKKSALQGYVIRNRGEETLFNVTLIEKLRTEFDIKLNGLDPLPTDDSGVDIKGIFALVRQAIKNKKNWDIAELAFIGQFSFSQFIMWKDLGDRSEELKKNKVVRGLIEGGMQDELPPLVDAKSLDDTIAPAEMAIPMSADSSQLAAVCSASKGSSFVLHGPPGTGKSQTITNIIANALFHGKSVLFIAEKMAALSVVQSRLEKIGIGDFCLELHSNKATKKDVMARLDRALKRGSEEPSGTFLTEADRIHNLRKELNAVVEAIHKVQPIGKSVYDLICTYEAHPELEGKLTIPKDLIDCLNKNIIDQWYECCDQLKVALENCGSIENHPLEEWTGTEYSEKNRNYLNENITRYIQALQKLKDVLEAVNKELPIIKLDNIDKINSFLKLDKNRNINYDIAEKLMSGNISELESILSKVSLAGIQRNHIFQNLSQLFYEDFFAEDCNTLRGDWNESQTKWGPFKFFATKTQLKRFIRYAKRPADIKASIIPEVIEQLSNFNKFSKVIEAQSSSMKNLFGELWKGESSDWTQLQNLFDQTKNQLDILYELFDGLTIHDIIYSKQNLQTLAQKPSVFYSDIQECYNEAVDYCQKINLVAKTSMDKVDLNNIQEQIDICTRWKNNLHLFRDWAYLQETKQKAHAQRLDFIFEAIEKGSISADCIQESLDTNIAYTFLLEYIDSEPELRSFNAKTLQAKIDRYKSCCEKFEALTRQELIYRLSARVPRTSYSATTSEIGILKKNIANGCRTNSLRNLFDSIPSLLRKLSPCMLMSPLSVAQYINPNMPKFDLVVFDEASQMPTCEAVGAIARGENLIVVGDPKQLPPTSFFKKETVDEDNIDKADLESILDDCRVISMPETHLQWHYRSKDESLIAFSNYMYYDQNLYTFPSPANKEGQVKFNYIQSVYERSGRRVNPTEAKAVVQEIVKRISDKETRKKSIGVVTFNSNQQNLIEDLLDDYFREHPEIEEFSKEASDPLFIKNLENVQGDERDIIIFSVGYGPDKDGRVAMNFGPLNNNGGERRLNVAVSRAREEMIVFSALQPEDIDLNKTNALGVKGLKNFLAYAKYGNHVLAELAVENVYSSCTDSFKNSVKKELEKMGYQVELDIGTSRNKVDIAVVHPEKENHFILGILCDGDSYRDTPTARDRNILQQKMFAALGWNTTRIWSVNWFSDRDLRSEILKKIDDQIKDLLQAKPVSAVADDVSAIISENSSEETSSKESAFEKEKQDPSLDRTLTATVALPALTTYKSILLDDCSDKDIYDSRFDLLLNAQLIRTVKAEYPISIDVLVERIATAWGVKKTAKFVEFIHNKIHKLHFPSQKEGDNTFLWDTIVMDEVPYRTHEKDGYKRNLEDISVTEMATAIRAVIKDQGSINRDEAERILAKMFGYTKCTAQMKEPILRALLYASSRKIISLEEEKVVEI